MRDPKHHLAKLDPVWERIRQEAEQSIEREALLGGFMHQIILQHPDIESALSHSLAQKLASAQMSEQALHDMCALAYANEPELALAARADIMATYDRDPACHRYMQPLLYFKGFQAVQAYRVAHYLWKDGRIDLAYVMQSRTSEVFGIDIHPNARIGKGLMIDHAHSVVIGETAVVGDNVSMLHAVTLGGTGKEEHFEGYFVLMRRVAPYAQQAGVHLTMKPHGGISLTTEDLLAACEKVNHPAFAICFDPGNIVYYTKGERRPEADVDKVAPKVSTAIVKDCVVNAGVPDVMVTPGDGLVDFDIVLGKLQRGGFRGPYYVECVGGQTLPQIDRDVAFTLGYVKGILAGL